MKSQGVSIPVNLEISREVAKLCLSVLNLYVNNTGDYVVLNRQSDGATDMRLLSDDEGVIKHG